MQHVTNEYLNRFKLKFNYSDPNCLEHQYLWLKSVMQHFNDLIQIKPLRTMNDLLDLLDMPREPIGFNMVFEKGDRLKYTAIEQLEGSILITFNLSND